MADKSPQNKKFVIIAKAEDLQLAEDYGRVLNENRIEYDITINTKVPDLYSVMLMVRKDDFEKAYDIINAQKNYRDEYDYIFDSKSELDNPENKDNFFLYLDPNEAA